MIRIERDALYTRSDLVELLKPLGIDADGFVARIKPVKRFRLAWWGKDLIDAIQKTPPLGEMGEAENEPEQLRNATGRRRCGREPSFEKLDGYLDELRKGGDG